MTRIGIAGVGFMGMIHFLASRHLRDARVTAICTRDAKKRAGDWRGIKGNFGPAGTQMDLAGVKAFETFDQMLADKEIDLVDICTPTNLHRDMAVSALKAGKHVLVEKAIALTIEDADAMIQAARQAGKLLMVAHVLPFFPEFAYAADVIRKGTYGKLVGGHFKRVISPPDWSGDIGDASKTGGPAVDLHIHDTHFIGLVAGVPKAIFSSGVVGANGSVDYLTTNYLYGPGGPAVSCSSGAVSAKSREFVHGYEIYLEKATLTYESGTVPLMLLPSEGKPQAVTLPAGTGELSAFTDEIQTAVNAVASGKEADLLSGQLARDALAMCLKECESVRSNQPVKV
jgi:predicted dehydrogenase